MSKEIKYGDIKYFTLLRLQETLNINDFRRLDLLTYDKLRMEVELKIESLKLEHKQKAIDKKQIEAARRKFDFWCSCMVYHRTKEYF